MLFDSIAFLIFLPAVFFFYWFLFQKHLRLQNCFILFVSYLFYGWWDWRYLVLLIFCSAVNYFTGKRLARAGGTTGGRRFVLVASSIVNIGLLCVFKYFNFFVDNFISAFGALGIHLAPRTLNVILPIGISFYTLKAMGYTIDVYKRKLEPTRDMVAFFSFVAFFPQLMAGPIDRAANLLPQFTTRRTFEYDKAVDGMRQILWGFFKKIVIADNCAEYVNQIFGTYRTLPASALVLGAVYFAFQIYGDFSGYSDIAIGACRLFGFGSMRNFNLPYFSRNIAEFWRRWHISLTTWLRDYLYIPLGGNRGSAYRTIRNIFIVFLICGLWHGANWTFLAWGFINALYFIPSLVRRKSGMNAEPVAENRIWPSMKESLHMGATFVLAAVAWIFFRADSITQALSYIGHIFSLSLFTIPEAYGAATIIPLLLIMLAAEWLTRDKLHALESLTMRPILRWSLYYGLVGCILYVAGSRQQFIYFQF